MSKSKGLLIKQLILVGYRKNYSVPFYPGVHIIYGDADTGKSSILRIIYYMLGGKQVKLDEEVSSSVSYAVLELDINGSHFCIVRDLYNYNKDVEVYRCTYEKIKEHYPEKFFSSISQSTLEKKSLSSFIINELNFPSVEIKQAPSKDISETARLSILDLFKYMYLNQDDVGSTHMLNIGNYVCSGIVN
ncbi:AAA family ATPase, partial [Vibrio anguillarum]